MKSPNVILTIGIFFLAFYVMLTLLMFNALADLNKMVKVNIFQMYKVPLENNNHGRE
jgi:hypothetical protein